MTAEKTDPVTRLVPCPRCRRSVRYDTSNAFRPFCSERCKNEDIVSWAEGGYRIPGKPAHVPVEGEDGEGDEDE